MADKQFGCFRFMIIIIAIFIILVLLTTNKDRMTSFVQVYQGIPETCISNEIVTIDDKNPEQLLKLMRHIIRAHRYSRSGKTKYEITEAYKIVQNFINESKNKTIQETFSLMSGETFNTTSENEEEEPEICPEIYMGMMYGLPMYYTGYKTDYDNCTGQPLGSLVTVLVNLVDDIPVENLDSVLSGFAKYYSNISIIVGHSSKQNLTTTYKNARSLPLINAENQQSGQIWKQLAINATTKYVIVAHHLLRIDNHTSIERLLRFLSYQVADVVGTSHRYVDGRWFRGCHTSALRNYTLKFVDGYDLSYNSCIYCDYLTGPFAIRRDNFLNIIDPKLSSDTVFVDMFTRMSQESKTILSCPDVMVTVEENELHNLTKSEWLPFVQKWKLNRIVFTNGDELRFTCSESKLKCPWTGGLIMPICCIQELADMMKFTFKTFTDNNILLEMEGGSNVGAAKMYGIIPYERDADFDWLGIDHTKIASLIPFFKDHGYALSEDKNDYKCAGNKSILDCGYFRVKNGHWRMEMWGINYLESDESMRVGFTNRTQVMIDGMWMTSFYSPAAAARNQYGDDIYQHVEHWITLGYKSGWVQPKTGRWVPCPRPGFHGCLDLYLPVGDIQFKDIWI